MAVKKINFIWIFLWAGLLFSCHKKTEKISFTGQISKEAAYVLHINTPTFFQADPDYFLHLLHHDDLHQIFQNDSIPSGSTFNFIITSKNSEPFLVMSFPPGFIHGTVKKNFTLNGRTYKLIIWHDHTFYRLRLPNHLILSDKESAIRKIIRSGRDFWMNNEQTKKYLHYTNAEADAHWFWFPGNTLNNAFVPVSYSFLAKHLGKVYLWDMESAGVSQYTGLALQQNEKYNLLQVFVDLPASKPDVMPFLHPATRRFLWLDIASFPVFSKHWNQYKTFLGYQAKTSPLLLKSLKSVTEVILKNNEKYLITRFQKQPYKNQTGRAPESIYHDIGIYQTPDSTIITSFFYPLLKKQAYPYVFYFQNHLIWTTSVTTSHRIIDALENGQNLTTTDKNFAEQWKNLPGKAAIAFFDINKTGFAVPMNNGFFTSLYSPLNNKKAGQQHTGWQKTTTIHLPAPVNSPPQWIYNHRSKQYEIVYQDKLNRITLISPEGKIRWQRNVDAPVLGKIFPVDMFRNGKTQLLFATSKGLYIIDILGNYVKPFPIPIPVSGPVSLFDYDNNKNYRIFIPENKKLVVYDIQGKKIKGFREVSLDADLQYPVQHLRIGTKDFLFVQEKNARLQILNRRGETRIPVKRRFSLKMGRWFPYKGNFVSLTKDGKIVRIHTNGKTDYLSFKPGILYAYFKDNHYLLIYPDKIITDKQSFKDILNGNQAKIVRKGKKHYYIIKNQKDNKSHILSFDRGHPQIHTVKGDVFGPADQNNLFWISVKSPDLINVIMQ